MIRDDDLRLLEMLHMREVEGLSYMKIGDRFGRSTGAAIGALSRINKAADAVSCRCRRKKNRDCGMPSRWWAA